MQKFFDLSVGRAGEKQNRVVFLFPVADKVFLKHPVFALQTAFEIVDKQILVGTGFYPFIFLVPGAAHF